MVKEFTHMDWALVLGGSRGLGLASAKKLAKHGMNICIVHRDRKADMEEIEKDFTEIRNNKVKLLSLNKDLLRADHQSEILSELKSVLGENGKVKCLLHSVAKGNLKPMSDEGSGNLTVLDFEITLQAMALSLYDWFKLLFDQHLLAKDCRVISFTSE